MMSFPGKLLVFGIFWTCAGRATHVQRAALSRLAGILGSGDVPSRRSAACKPFTALTVTQMGVHPKSELSRFLKSILTIHSSSCSFSSLPYLQYTFKFIGSAIRAHKAKSVALWLKFPFRIRHGAMQRIWGPRGPDIIIHPTMKVEPPH